MSIDFKNLDTTLKEMSSDISIPISSLLDLFVESIVEYLSSISGIALSMAFDQKTYSGTIYAIRRITKEGIGFGEITQNKIEEYENKYPDKKTFEYESLEELSFIKQKLQDISLNHDLNFFSRNDIIKISNNFKNKILQLNKEREYNFYIDKQGEMVKGTVVRIESSNLILSLGFGEGLLAKKEMIPGDYFPLGATVEAYIHEVKRDTYKYQVILSRTRPEFLARLMEAAIPEIESGLIEIKAIAREPGSRAKVAVYADEYARIKPVGVCIGRDGIRIKAVRSIVGENIDIVEWHPEMGNFVENLLGIQLDRIIVHEGSVMEVIFAGKADSLELKGLSQNLRLTAKILGMRKIKLTSSEEADIRQQKEKDAYYNLFQQVGFEESQIKKLFENEIVSFDDLVSADPEMLANMLELDQEKINEIIAKVNESMLDSLKEEYREAGIDEELAKVPHLEYMSPRFFIQRQIYTKHDLAQKDSEEVQSLFHSYLSDDEDVQEVECENIVRWSRTIQEKVN